MCVGEKTSMWFGELGCVLITANCASACQTEDGECDNNDGGDNDAGINWKHMYCMIWTAFFPLFFLHRTLV